MPGLLGIVSENALDEQLLNRMTNSLNYEEFYRVDKYIGSYFGCTRVHLGIFSPEPQPIFNEDESLCIFMEGKIYDYLDPKKELIGKGHTFNLNNDPEFILHLYEEYREDFGEKLKNLNGTFLIAIYDNRLHKLTICNDRYGFRPLYWCARSNYLLFSTEIKAILQDKSFKRAVNLEAMADFFSFGYVLGDKTLINGIKLLPAASILTYTNNRIEIKKYWDWNQIKKTDVINDEGEIVEKLGRLWLQAVERRMRGKTRIGLSLSGGLDSRAIASAISAKHFPVHAVTFGKKGCDDYKIAKKVCEILGIKHHFVEATGERWFSGIEKTVYITEGLLNVIHQHSWGGVDVMKEYFDVNLNGFAGDLVVGGSYLTNEFLNIKDIDEYCNRVFLKMNAGYVSIKDEREFYSSQVFHLIHKLSQKSLEKEVKQEIKNSGSSDYLFLNNRVRRFTLMGTVCLQTKLENCKPFFDNDFIEFVYSLPNELRFKSYIYNKMLLNFFPDTFKSIPYQKTGLPIETNKIIQKAYYYYNGARSIANRLLQKIWLPRLFKDNRNFVDYNNWMRNNRELKQYIYDTILNEKTLNRGYFNPSYIRRIIDDHMSGKNNNPEIIGLLLTFELFNRMFIDGSEKERESENL